MSPALLLLSLLACRGDGAATCELTALSPGFPAEGADPVSRTAPVLLWAEGGALGTEDVAFTVTADGAEVAGTVSVLDDEVRWTPDDALPAGAAVSWQADACGQEASGSYTTGEHGDPVDGEALVDGAWALDLDAATWVEPAAGAALFGQLFAGDLVLGVQAADDGTLDLLGGAAEEVEPGWIQQDPCVPTFDFAPVPFAENNPYVEVGPTTLELTVEGLPVVVQQVYLGGAFVDGGATIDDAWLMAELDAREVASGVGTSWQQLCELVELYAGIECVACSTDDTEACIGLHVEEIPGTFVEGLRLAPNPDPQECEDGDSRPEEG